MNRFGTTRAPGRVVALAATMTLAAGCAHVNEEQLAVEMDALRAEMRAADQRVEDDVNARISALESDVDARIQGLESDLAELAGEFDLTVERLEQAVRFNTPVHFDFDDATIPTEGREALDRVAGVLSAYYADAVITIEGFTDPAGSPDYNLALGQRRADAVRDYLGQAGIPPTRMRAVSYGEAAERRIVPDGQGPGTEGWENRRASIVVDFSGADSAGVEPAV